NDLLTSASSHRSTACVIGRHYHCPRLSVCQIAKRAAQSLARIDTTSITRVGGHRPSQAARSRQRVTQRNVLRRARTVARHYHRKGQLIADIERGVLWILGNADARAVDSNRDRPRGVVAAVKVV